jgi:membrane dipeptidase
MGRAVVAEMNRVGLVVDMSHAGERSTLEAIEASARPVAITHANPELVASCGAQPDGYGAEGADQRRRDAGLFALPASPGRAGRPARCRAFARWWPRRRTATAPDNLGIGSDLCQDQPDSVVQWMRAGRWTKRIDYGEGSADAPGFPPQPGFFRDNRDFPNLRDGLSNAGFDRADVDAIVGDNWLRFFDDSFGSMP